MHPPTTEPNPPNFPYHACDTCGWFHKDNKKCTGRPGWCRLTIDGLRIFRLLVRRAGHELHAEWKEASPEFKAGFEDFLKTTCKDVEEYMKKKAAGDRTENAGEGIEGGKGQEKKVRREGLRAMEPRDEWDWMWEKKFEEISSRLELEMSAETGRWRD